MARLQPARHPRREPAAEEDAAEDPDRSPARRRGGSRAPRRARGCRRSATGSASGMLSMASTSRRAREAVAGGGVVHGVWRKARHLTAFTRCGPASVRMGNQCASVSFDGEDGHIAGRDSPASAVSYGPLQALAASAGASRPARPGCSGPNGAGKTTLLKTLLGFLKPDRGTDDGVRPRPRAEPLEVRRRIGYMPEVDCHLPGMTAARFVAFAGELSGLPRRRGHEPRARGALLRRPRRGALPHGRHLLDRHEAAREAGAGAGARPGPAAARRADERARPGGPRGDAGAHPRRGGAPRDEPHPVLAPAARRRVGVRARDRAEAGRDRGRGAHRRADRDRAARSTTCA